MPTESPLPAILLIEQDELTLEIYRRELSKSFTVFATTKTDDALKTLAAHDIRALVIEPQGQWDRGWSLIDSVREIYPDRELPVIVCSTRDPGDEAQSRAIATYLTKPVLPKALREQTLRVLGLREERSKAA